MGGTHASRAVVRASSEMLTTPHTRQVLDTGLDETSCFFIDGDGQEVTHGYYYDAMGSPASSTFSSYSTYGVFQGGDFSFYPERRKVGIPPSWFRLPVFLNILKNPQPYTDCGVVDVLLRVERNI